jgi:hypothetical protein
MAGRMIYIATAPMSGFTQRDECCAAAGRAVALSVAVVAVVAVAAVWHQIDAEVRGHGEEVAAVVGVLGA